MLAAAVGLGGALLLVLANHRGHDVERAPNLVLLVIDTLRRPALRTFSPDAPETVALSGLASRSARFREAVSPAPWTLPATASLLTGVYPDRHGLVGTSQRFGPDVRTLATALRDAGYETVAFTDGGYVDPTYFRAGFDRYNEFRYDGARDEVSDLPRGGRPGRTGRSPFDRAVAFLAGRRPRDRPFFLFLQTYVVHDYYFAHPWAVASLGPFPEPENGRSYSQCLTGYRPCSAREQERLRDLYRADVTHVDKAAADLLAVFRSRFAADSYFIFVSDHGEGFDFARHRICHGGRLHADLLQVPVLISGPGVAPADVDLPFSLIDVMPTALGLLGVAPPPDLDGVSFADWIAGRTAEPPVAPGRTLLAMEYFFYWRDGQRREAESIGARPLSIAVLRDGAWYIEALPTSGPVEAASRSAELYDMRRDPGQTTNLADGSLQLAPLRSVVEDRLRARYSEGWKGQKAPPPPAVREKLRALGYLQ